MPETFWQHGQKFTAEELNKFSDMLRQILVGGDGVTLGRIGRYISVDTTEKPKGGAWAEYTG